MPEVAQATITVTPVLQGAQQAITKEMNAAAGSAGTSAGAAAGKNLSAGLGKSMSSAGSALSKSVTAPIVGIGAAAVASWKEVDAGLDTIVEKTGASGEALNGMKEILSNITSEIPTDFQTAGAAIGEVNTRFGLTGKELEGLSGQFVKFAKLNNQDVSSSVDSVSKMMAGFGLEAGDAGKMLDALNVVGQQTGVDVGTLANAVAQNAKQFQEMGLSAEESASFLGQASMAGLESSTAMMGLKTAMKNATADGKTLDEALSGFQETMTSNASESDKLAAAYELFGTRAGGAIANAVENGTLNLSNFSSSLGDFEGSVDSSFEGTTGPMDNFQTTLSDLNTVGADLVNSAGPMLADILGQIADGAKGAADAWNGLPSGMQETIIKGAAILAVAGPLLSIGGSLVGVITTIGGGLVSVVTGLTGTAAAATASAAPVAASATSFTALAGSALQMVAAGAAFMMVAQGMSMLANAAIRVAAAGAPAIGVLAGMAVGIGALMYVASAVGPALTAGAVGMVAFGASMLLIGASVAVASAGITMIIAAVTNLVSVVSANAESINSIVSNVGTTVSGVITTISGGITQVIDAISGGISGVLDSVAGIFDSIGKAAVNAGTGFQKVAAGVKSLAGVGIVKIGTTLGAAADGIRKIASAAGAVSSGSSNMSNLAKSVTKLGSASKTASKSMTTFGTSVKTSMTKASSAISGAKLDTSMKSMMNKVQSTANSSINSLKNTFSNTKFSFNHHIAVPHFSMSGSFNAKTKSVPSVHTSWYAKAAELGARFTFPTIIGVGDAAQPEILLGENKLKELTGAGKGNIVNYITVNGAENPEEWASRFARQMRMEVRMA